MSDPVTIRVSQLDGIEKPMWYRIMLEALVTKYGKELVRAELVRGAAGKGPNVVSIAVAKEWPRMKPYRNRWNVRSTM
jgi:hypothetical protein